MEQATPPPSPVQPTSATQNCQWCTKPMDAAAVRCPNCGKLRKDIYNDKIKCYSFCALGGILIGISIPMMRRHNDYYATSSNSSLGTVLLVVGILWAIVGIFFWYKVSQRMKTYWWS